MHIYIYIYILSQIDTIISIEAKFTVIDNFLQMSRKLFISVKNNLDFPLQRSEMTNLNQTLFAGCS